MVALGCPRLPVRGLGGYRGERPVTVARLVGCEPVDAGQPGPVRQHHPHGDRLFATGGELGPHGGDRGVEIERAALGQEQGAEGRSALGGRVHAGDRVRLPRPAGLDIGDATPYVDHRSAVVVDGTRRAHVFETFEVGREGVGDCAPAVLDRAADEIAAHRWRSASPRARRRWGWVVGVGLSQRSRSSIMAVTISASVATSGRLVHPDPALGRCQADLGGIRALPRRRARSTSSPGHVGGGFGGVGEVPGVGRRGVFCPATNHRCPPRRIRT